MSDNISAKDATGTTITLRTRADPSNIQTQLIGADVGAQLDGHSATLGATADPAVTTNVAGTLSAKLRGLVSIFSDVWDSTNHKLRVTTGSTVSSTSAVTSVTADTAPVNLLLANTARVAATIYNNSTATLTLKLGASPSTASFTKILAANEYFVVPGGYTGVITGLWSAVNGAALVTELS